MVDITTLIMGEAVIVMGADLLASGLLLKCYIKHRRRSALMFSLAWFFDFLAITFSSTSGNLELLSVLFLPTFSAFIFAGAIYILTEEGMGVKSKALLTISPAPFLFMLYVLGVYLYTGDPEWTATAAVSLGITGVFVSSAGVFMRELVEIYHSAAKYFYISLVLFGFHLIPAALFGQMKWYAPIGFSLSAVLIILMLVTILRMMRSWGLARGTPGKETPKTAFKPGVLLLTPHEYQQIKKELEQFPVLAFLRDISNASPKWIVYFVTTTSTTEGDIKTVHPTELAKMGETIYRYLKEMNENNLRGTIVLDCTEYLILQNSEKGFLRFISKIRDFTVLYKGTLILVVDPESIGKSLMAQLERVLE
jgi:hypothetical protein